MSAIRRIVYRSRARSRVSAGALDDLLASARRANEASGVSGVLWTDGERFAQVVEGPPEAVARTMTRIVVDPRHEDVVRLVDERVAERAFADWRMARLAPWDDPAEIEEALAEALATAPEPVRSAFELCRRGA